ncbi:MAG: aldehyde dehydrogenase family protein [Flavobacteriales bacterium]
MGSSTVPTSFQINELVALRSHFDSGITRTYKARRDGLKALKGALKKHEEALVEAMHADMRKPRFEAYMADIGLVYSEISDALENLSEWMHRTDVSTPISLWPASSAVHPQPLGVVLIVSPWNYPVVLALSPLVGAIAAGNCAVLKPSNEAPRTSDVLERITTEAFRKDHVLVVQGSGSAVVPPLIDAFHFDHIFFTGSTSVGRKILAQAAPQLVPVTLELGGKSPVIVDRKANIDQAAKRIAWSKFFNAGQTCIATDHALVHASAMEPFLASFAKHTDYFYGKEPRQSPHFARLVNDKNFERVRGYLGDGRILIGGEYVVSERYIAPTVLTEVPLESSVMKEEIFGPILPVIPWNEPEEVLAIVRRNPTPLALYVFSKSRSAQRYFTERIAFGGGCINHCLLHFGNPELPFGGVGTSGMGRYHGTQSFDLFSHYKGIVRAGSLPEPGIQYPPYSGWKERILRWALR